jgi:flagellar biosynthesis/type III secretory pathway protein FliH
VPKNKNQKHGPNCDYQNYKEPKMSKDLDEKVDQLEAAVDPNTVISIGGYSFTPAKLMIAGTIVTSALGFLYGAFEVYKDYMSMKEAIQTYVAPDLSEIDKRISILEQNNEKTAELVRDVNTNIRQDLRRLEAVVEGVERGQRTGQREVAQEVKEVRQNVDNTLRSVTQEMNKLERETAQELRNIRSEVDRKIKQALDNPLSN